MLFEYPTKEEWIEISKSYPFEKLSINRDDFLINRNGIDNIDNIKIILKNNTTMPWARHLVGRLYEVRKSFVFIKYYFNKGIPDDEYKKIGVDGGTEFFTKSMTNRQHLILIEFCYYVDIFYYKIFSVFDSLGHLLNEMFSLGLIDNNVNFKNAIIKLKSNNKDLYNELNKIRGNHEFDKANTFRDDFTHNFSPCKIGPGYKKTYQNKKKLLDKYKFTINKILNKLTFGQIRLVIKSEENHSIKVISFLGGGDYMPSKDIINNAIKILDLLAETLNIIKCCKKP